MAATGNVSNSNTRWVRRQKPLTPIDITNSGLHFCPRAIDCLRYYSLKDDRRYAEVEAEGDVVTWEDECATNRLRVVRELSREEFAALCTGTLTWNEGGQKVKECHYESGLPHGQCTVWHRSSAKSNEWTYVHGLRHGAYTMWWSNGAKREESTYERGEQHGCETTWYADGTLNHVCHYQHGVEHGMSTCWHQNGAKRYEYTYENGKPHGLCRSWHPNGEPGNTYIYVHGKITN